MFVSFRKCGTSMCALDFDDTWLMSPFAHTLFNHGTISSIFTFEFTYITWALKFSVFFGCFQHQLTLMEFSCETFFSSATYSLHLSWVQIKQNTLTFPTDRKATAIAIVLYGECVIACKTQTNVSILAYIYHMWRIKRCWNHNRTHHKDEPQENKSTTTISMPTVDVLKYASEAKLYITLFLKIIVCDVRIIVCSVLIFILIEFICVVVFALRFFDFEWMIFDYPHRFRYCRYVPRERKKYLFARH